MPLLSEEFTSQVGPDMLTVLAWRAMWLHAAGTGPGADALALRDRAALTLVATSVFGVEVNAVRSTLAPVRYREPRQRPPWWPAWSGPGHLSMDANLVDLSGGDLAWIRAQDQRSLTQPRP